MGNPVGRPGSLRAPERGSSLASALATIASLVLLFPAYAAFAFLGAFGVSLAAAATYALSTSRRLEEWRDGDLP